MSGGVKAIETIWKGYRFRSRTEARWAVFLEAAGIIFDYEPEGVVLPSGPYLPDFRFRTHDRAKHFFEDREVDLGRAFWLEIKGQEPTDEEKQKCWELAVASGDAVFLAVGAPDVRPQIYRFMGGDPRTQALFAKHDGRSYFAACNQRGGLCLAFPEGRPLIDPDDGTVYPPSAQWWLGHQAPADEYPPCDGEWRPTITAHLQRAYDASRSARFEFGQTDPRWLS